MAVWVGAVSAAADDATYSLAPGDPYYSRDDSGNYIRMNGGSPQQHTFRRGSAIIRGLPFTSQDHIASAVLRGYAPSGYEGLTIDGSLSISTSHGSNAGPYSIGQPTWDGTTALWDITDTLIQIVQAGGRNLGIRLHAAGATERRLYSFEGGQPLELEVEWTQAGPPSAAFTYAVADGEVSFTDLSTPSLSPVVAWRWDFGDGATSTEQHPVHQYERQGDYTVTLTATAADDSTDTTSAPVHVPPWRLEAAITGAITGRTVDLAAVVVTPDPPVVSWQWNMGDGTLLTGPDIQHTYTTPGTYTVTLTITDAADNTVTAVREFTTREVTDRADVPPDLWDELMAARVRTTTASVDIINPDNVIVATLGGPQATHRGVINGSDVIDETRHIRGTATLTINDPSLVPAEVDDLLHPLAHNRLRVWWLLQAPDGTWIREPRVTGYVARPATVDDGLVQLTVQIEDAAARVAAARWGTVPDIEGRTISQAVQIIWNDRVPNVPTRITPTDQTLPEDWEPGEPGGNPNDDIDRLAEAAGYVWYVDPYGTLTFEPAPTPGVVRASMVEGEGCQVTELSRELSLEDTANVVQVISTSNEVDPPVEATATVTDEDSPLSVDRGWLFVAEPVESGEITTTEQARELAETKLAEYTALSELVEVKHRADPTLLPGMSVYLEREASKVSGVYQVQSVSLTLGHASGQRTVMHPRKVRL